MVTLADIESARKTIADSVFLSPCAYSETFSRLTGNRIYFKLENLQMTGSFKERGAANKLLSLTAEERARGVVTASAGNHAQGVAYHATRLGIHAKICMPVSTPLIKVSSTRDFGAEVILTGANFDEAREEAERICEAEDLTFVHPFDDDAVIAGQGTIGLELLEQQPDLEAVVVPIGGGGLIGGIAAYVKRVRPEVRIVGVQPEDSDAMARSLAAGRRVLLPHVGLFADGVAVKQVGEETFRLARKYVDEVITVDTDAICAALKDVFEDTRAILEPAGALAIAGVKAWVARERVEGRTLAAIACGANMNFDRLRFVAERAELGEQREAILAVTIPERPGSFRAFCALLGKRSVTEFNYRYADPHVAHLFVGIEVADRRETERLLAALKESRIEASDLSDNEMAKLHVRHLVGGHAPAAEHEILYRFEFPERPGALMQFLDSMSAGWNISLFHYRNHGDDYGRVLVGMQVPPGDSRAFRDFLDRLGYDYVDESANPAYRMFLGR